MTSDELAEVKAAIRPRYRKRTPNPRRAVVDKRRRDAMDLKLGGHSLQTIGLMLHSDPAVNLTHVSYVGGYGSRNYARGAAPVVGVTLDRMVAHDLAKQLRHSRLASETIRQEALTLALDKLDRAQSAIWPRVLHGEPRAQEVWLRNLEAQIKLQGLDQPSRVEVAVSVEGPQPSFQGEWAEKMWDALREVGAVQDAEMSPELVIEVEDSEERVIE